MNLAEAQQVLENLWLEATQREQEMKGTYSASDALKRRILNASDDDRKIFEQVVVSWMGSRDEEKLYDAAALIDELDIRSALPEMKRARRKLRLLPWRRDDFELVDDTIRDLESRP